MGSDDLNYTIIKLALNDLEHLFEMGDIKNYVMRQGQQIQIQLYMQHHVYNLDLHPLPIINFY